MSGLGSGGSLGNSIECKSLGRHQLVVVCGVELHQGTFGSTDPRSAVSSRIAFSPAVLKSSLKGRRETSASSMIRSLASRFRRAFNRANSRSMRFVTISRATSTSRRCRRTVAVDMFIRVSGREYGIGGLTFSKGATTDCRIGGTVRGINPTTQPMAVDLILRSNEKIGRETVDQHDIWSGELIFPNVPITVSNHP